MEAVSREGYLASSGHKGEAEFQAIYREYADILDRDVFDACIERYMTASAGSEERRAARMMLEWQVEAHAGQQLAALDEREVALESATTVTFPDGRVVPYQSASIDIRNTDDRAMRQRMDDARAAVVRSTFAPLRLEHLQREKEYVESLRIADDYNTTFEALSGISLNDLAGACAGFLRDTDAMWDDVRRELLGNAGIPEGEATRADMLAIFRLREYDDAFPSGSMVESIRRNCEEMSVDPSAHGRIIFDLDDRPGKRARAFCSPVRVPAEVYLVMRPHGGQTDYNTLLHELGHVLHFGYAREDYPFEYRWIGDNSVTESYAMLFDHRMMDRGWLLRYTQLGPRRVDAFLRAAAMDELHMLRRYCAKLIYEVQVYGGNVPWSSLPDLFVETLSKATGVQYQDADAFVDLDARYYSTRYLRAWQLQAILNDALRAQFDEDWWRNPATGPWLIRELFAEGQREDAEEIATRVAGGRLSFTPFVRGLEGALGG